MAIVLKYGAPGPILQSGFASGVGHRKNAQQEDLLKIWQQQQAQAFQGQQSELGRWQQRKLQENAQEFQAGQQGLQNQFNLDFRNDQRKYNTDQTALADAKTQKRFYQQKQFSMLPIPDHADASQRKELQKHKDAIGTLLGPEWDISDPITQKALADEFQGYEAKVKALEANAPKTITHVDNEGYQYDEPVSGLTTPVDKKTMQPLPHVVAAREAQAKAAVEQEKQAKAAQDAQMKQQETARVVQQKEQDSLAKEAHDLASEIDPATTQPKRTYAEALKEAADRQKQRKEFFSPAPASGTAPMGGGMGLPPVNPPQAQQQNPILEMPNEPVGNTAQVDWTTKSLDFRNGRIPGDNTQPQNSAAGQAPPKSQDQILQDFQQKQEVGQLKADLPAPTPVQLASPVMATSKAEMENLPHGSVVGPIAGPDGEFLYQWNAKAKKLVKIGPWTGKTPDRGPEQPQGTPMEAVEFSPGTW